MAQKTATRRDSEKVTVYVEPELKRDLEVLARHNQRSVAAEGKRALMRHLVANLDELDQAKSEEGSQS